MDASAICPTKLSLKTRLRAHMRNLAGFLLERFQRPAKIEEFEYIDPVTDETVYLSTGARYSVLHVGNKHFYFERLTGRFDGTCTSLEERVSNGVELGD
jgi:hypothetical protein